MSDVVKFRANIGKVYLTDEPSKGSSNEIRADQGYFAGVQGANEHASHQVERLLKQRIKEIENRLQQNQEDGFREAYEAGKQEGIQVGKSEVTPVLDYLKTIAGEVASKKDELVRDAEEAILKLSFAIARRIVGQQIKQDPDTVLSIVRESLKRVDDGSRVIVRVNPSDLENVKERRADIVSSIDVVKDLTIEGDAQVEPGGCVVETNSGTVDARLSTQFMELEAVLLEDFRHGRSEV